MEKFTVAKAAELMGITQQAVRVGLQQDKFQFGRAIKTSSEYTYVLFPAIFERETGIKVPE